MGILIRCALLMMACSLVACASNTRTMADSINPETQQYKTPACQRSFQLAEMHDDIKMSRTIATPTLLVLSGGSLFFPLLGINIGLDALDHLDASHVSKACGGFATPSENILEKVLLGAGFGILKK
jgi:hypothetical protein